jgi:hypothetical protein
MQTPDCWWRSMAAPLNGQGAAASKGGAHSTTTEPILPSLALAERFGSSSGTRSGQTWTEGMLVAFCRVVVQVPIKVPIKAFHSFDPP